MIVMGMHIYLRPLTVEDAATSYKWRNDPGLWKYTASHSSCEVTEEMERAWAARVIADSSRLSFAICLKDGTYIGNTYLTNIHNDTANFGIFIGDRTAQGHGYAREAIELLKVKAREHNIQKIHFGCSPANLPALFTYLKSGAEIDSGQWINLTFRLNDDRS